MKIPTTTWSPTRASPAIRRFLERPAVDPAAEEPARHLLDAVRSDGATAVCDQVRKFDGAELTPAQLRVPAAALRAARQKVDRDFLRAARETLRRVQTFARAGLRKDWGIRTAHGGSLGERFTPLDRVGVYVPGGTAPLVSTVLMTVPLARVAGVREIVVCTPPARDGSVNPWLLAALDLAGATEVYRVGGVAAIGLMAYGWKGQPRVQKIVGPGGAYVTAAKKLVYGQVALDLVAGPSEVAILADETADPRHVAADLLAQAEHGTGHEKALLVTTSAALLAATQTEVARQLATLSRRARIEPVLRAGTMLVRVASLEDGMELCNRFAPEHFELLVARPRSWLPRVRHAGAVFCGPWTPEVAGDFIAGPSHVLPTGGAAAMFSGLTVEDFRKKTSVIAFTRADLRASLPVLRAFGRVEGLDAHARSAAIRFEQP